MHRIDKAAKLTLYLKDLANTVFGISSHTRFLSPFEVNATSVPVKTLRVPEAYRQFYSFCYNLLKEHDSDVLTIEVSRTVSALVPRLTCIPQVTMPVWTTRRNKRPACKFYDCDM